MNNPLEINWGLISAFLIFVSGYPYMRAIYTREIERPVISTWILWSGIGLLLFVTSYQAGVTWKTTLLPIFVGVTNPVIILVLSLRYGTYRWTTLDTICVGLCIVTVIGWQTTDSPTFGIVGGVLADIAAATPQIRKSWIDPKDEPVFPWAMFAFASALNLLAIKEWTVAYWLFPVYMTVTSTLITLPLVLHRLKKVRA